MSPSRSAVCTAAMAAAVILLAPGAAVAQDASPGVEYIRSAETAALGLPFSDAVRVGNVLYLSGMVGIQPGTLALVEGGIEPETRRILDSMQALLEANGSSLGHVFKCTVMLADMADWPRFNAIYTEYFTGNLPARSALGANGLALDARVELECWALVPS